MLEIFNSSFAGLWGDVMSFVPQLITAVLILVAGWIIGGAFMHVVVRLFKVLKINDALNAAGVDRLAEKAGHKLDAGVFVGKLVKWFIILVFFVAALDMLNLDQVSVFLRDVVLGYLPRVIVTVLILLGAFILANVVSAAVTTAARAGDFGSAELLGNVARYAIIIFAILAALNQLEIAPELVQTLFAGLVFAASLALGLAFGLGGREAASKCISSMGGDKK